MNPLITFKLIVLCLLAALRLQAQMPMIDRGEYIEGLWCFPLHTDSLTYVYLPNSARFAFNEEKGPRFSYLRYSILKPKEGNTTNSISEADGGGILHMLVLYETTPETVLKAEDALRKKNGNNPKLKLRGPMAFEKGTYALISSIITEGSQKKETKLIATGEAPVLENTSLALSFSLNPVQSKLLLESFKMKTPDVSIVFDLSFTGLTESYDAELDIDWSEAKKSQAFNAGVSVYFVNADVELGFEKMRRDNAIKLKVNGSGGMLEGLLNTVYDKLLNLMFRPVHAEKVDQQNGMSAIDALLGPNGPLSSRKTTGFGLNVGYQLKEMQSEGHSHLFFKGRSTVQRHHYVVFNVSSLYQRYGGNPDYFKDVPLWDPTFQQREIFIGVDGDLEKEFQKMLNNVTVNVRKKHQSGQTTLDSKLINKDLFKAGFKPLSMLYGWDADSNRTQWMEYEYMNIWQFQGGGSYQTPWEKSSAAMVNVFTPFTRKTILFDGDLAGLQSKGVRMVSITLNYPFFGRINRPRLTLRPGDNISEKTLEVTLPNDVEEIDYEITWQKSDGTILTKKGKDKFGLIFIDELPTQN
ncbi:hypothetical protein [Haliscomenobacter hydrossis]|uniref:Uncharacterized protein n=1 Tax=Haliscomenobacter hydrossis (strain ATCC 27775 / DSM 1100 / LMG 10767 / O) TaxID=760192 RepID=F4L0R6_HALH1|nr:hypothetical protein [Haliscomenobacter hydrossis]AEE49548.1 hypothetical protein Halhy_1659 [Haliscomenobacter hydrossis DSM 1100]